MRITEIHVHSFGIWRDATFNLDAPLTCFYGPNEAGKSTLMGFIRSILFGFPTRARLAERYEPPHGGAHGGALTLVDAQGRRIRVERHGGGGGPNARGRSAAGIVKVSRDDGTSGGEERLEMLLGGITGELFRNVFAFSLSELQEIRSLQSEEISAFLFSAGMGAGGHAIMQAERRLAAEMEQLYKPKGSKQEINQLLKSMEEKEQDIRRSKEHVGQYNAWLSELTQLDGIIVQREIELKQVQAELEWFDKCRQSRDRWIQMLVIRQELDELPAFSTFPEDAVIRFEALQAEQDRLMGECRQKEHLLAQLQHKLKNSSIDYRILQQKSAITSLMGQASVYQEGKRAVIELQVELDGMEEKLATLLRQINENWTDETLQRFSVSVSLREQVRLFRERLGQYKQEQWRWVVEVQRIRQTEEAASRKHHEKVIETAALQEKTRLEFIWFRQMSEMEMRMKGPQLKREYEQWKQLKEELHHLKLRHGDLRLNRDLMIRMTGNVFADGQQFTDELLKYSNKEQIAGEPKPLQRQSGKAGSASNPLSILHMFLWIGLGLNMALPALLLLMAGEVNGAVLIFLILAAVNIYLYIYVRRQSASNPRKADNAKDQYHTVLTEQGNALSALNKEMMLLEEQVTAKEKIVRGLINSLINTSALNELEAAAAVAGFPGSTFANVTQSNSSASHISGSPIHPDSAPSLNFGSARHPDSAASLSFASAPGSDSLNVNDEFMDGLLQAMDQWLQAKGRMNQEALQITEYGRVLDDICRQREDGESKEQEAQAKLNEVVEEWKSWLQVHSLPLDSTPEAVVEIFQYAEQGKQWLQQREKCRSKLESLIDQLNAFEDSCSLLFDTDRNIEGSLKTDSAVKDRESVGSPLDAVFSLKQRSADLEQQTMLLDQYHRDESDRNLITEAIQELKETVEDKAKRISSLWEEAGADEEEQFRLHARYHARRNELINQLRHEEVFLETWVSPDKQQELHKVLREYDLVQLNSLMDHRQQQVSLLEGEMNQLREQRGKLRNEIEKLQLGTEHSRKIHQFEEQVSILQDRARRWATLAICCELFKKAKEVYEREKQPGVLLRASKYFQMITEGRYNRVMAPIGENKIIVERENGQPTDTAYLSRGTAEQLYLAMRFALADEYAVNRKVTLPFVMDDIFVNFDSGRLRNTLSLISKVSGRHQMILFTCHPHVQKAVSEAIPNYLGIDL